MVMSLAIDLSEPFFPCLYTGISQAYCPGGGAEAGRSVGVL